MKKTENVLVRFRADVKEQFLEVAEYRGLSMSGLVTMLVKDEYRKMKQEMENEKH